MPKPTDHNFLQLALEPISQTDLSSASYHFVLDLSPKTDLSLLVKLAPGDKMPSTISSSFQNPLQVNTSVNLQKTTDRQLLEFKLKPEFNIKYFA